ncbi:MAG TPA: hypothetical protein DHV07_06230 [Flavobacteriales bacterium]|jgi:phospholipid N-methyltransferase|nr:hypothetical protein [Flavobacteriales bacterium]
MAFNGNGRLGFLLNFLRHPLRNASVVPSSKVASRNMFNGLDVEGIRYVIELGPGTGVFTQELYDRLHPDAQVLVVELDEGYVASLKDRFGDRFDIVQSSACRLESLLNERNWPHVDLVLSGLPFVLPGAVKEPMLSAIKGLTDRGTVFRFFTYMPPLMKPHYRMFQLRRVCFVLRNFPPMYIYSVN